MAIGQLICFPALIMLCVFRDTEDEELCDDERWLDVIRNEDDNGGAGENSDTENASYCLLSASDRAFTTEVIDEGIPCGGCGLPKNRAIPILIGSHCGRWLGNIDSILSIIPC